MNQRPPHSSFAPDPRRAAWAAFCAAAVFVAAPALGADPPPPGASGFVIHLRNGGFVHGDPADSAKPQIIRWRSPAFAEPLELGTHVVGSIHRLGPSAPKNDNRAYGFWLAEGDVVFGT